MSARLILRGMACLCGLTLLRSEGAPAPEKITAGGREFSNVIRLDYRNERLNIVSSSGVNSVPLEAFSLEEYEQLPEAIRKKIEGEQPWFMERLRATAGPVETSRELTTDVALEHLVLADTTLKNVTRLYYAKGILKARHASGLYVCPVIRLRKNEIAGLPPEFRAGLEAAYFFLREAPLPEHFAAGGEISGTIDRYLASIARQHQIVVSIDPIVGSDFIATDTVLTTVAVEGAEVLPSLQETFGGADFRLGVFHISAGLYFVSLRDAEYLQRALLSFMDGEMEEAARWWKSVSTRGTLLHDFLDTSIKLGSDTHLLSERAGNAINYLRPYVDARVRKAESVSISQRAVDQVNSDLEFLRNKPDAHFAKYFDEKSPIWSAKVPRQLKLQELNAVSALISQVVEIKELQDILINLQEQQIRILWGFAENTNLDKLSGQINGLREHFIAVQSRGARHQSWTVTDGARLLEMRRPEFDALKTGLDLSLSNPWHWDNRVFAGSEQTVGVLLRDRKFDAILLGESGKVDEMLPGQRRLLDAWADSIKKTKQETLGKEAASWLDFFSTDKPGKSTGLVTYFDSSGELASSTSILSAEAIDEEGSGTPLHDLVFSKKNADVSHLILKSVFIRGGASTLDPYSLHAMKDAVIWIQSRKGLAVKIHAGHLLLSFKQGLGLNIESESTGSAWAAAIHSELTGKPNFAELAMTGAIRPNGKPTAVGGIHLMAKSAAERGVVAMFIPGENEADAITLPAEILMGLQVITYDHIDQLLEILGQHPRDIETQLRYTGERAAIAGGGDSPETSSTLEDMSLSKLSTLYTAALYFINEKKYGEANYCLGKLVEAYPRHVSATILLKQLEKLNPESVRVDSIARLIGDAKALEEIRVEEEKNAPPPEPPKSWWERLTDRIKGVL